MLMLIAVAVIEVVVVIFAVARTTRLVTTDEITRRPRQAFVRARPEGSMLAYLVVCRWCASVWVAATAAVVWWLLSDTPRWSGRWWIDVPTLLLALSYATGLLVRAEPGS
jgi:hypothetical protein